MKRYFITGTDTDCGKTYVTSQLIKHYPRSAGLKPVASGCFKQGKGLVSSDAQELVKNNGLNSNLINPWRFELPIAPHIAAEKEGKLIDFTDLVNYCTQFELPNIDTLFIEGAGGLMVPLNNQHTWVDFLLASKIPVILVVGMKLGCINHALLTFSVLQSKGIVCAGWIANCIDPHMLAFNENKKTLLQLLDAPLLGLVPHDGELEVGDIEL